MATLRIPDQQAYLTNDHEIGRFLKDRGIFYDRWLLDEPISADLPDADVLAVYGPKLKPFMDSGGYRTVDMVTVTPENPNLPAIREKFLREHTHTEDEIRMFVQGEGLFWFHLERDKEEVFSVLCQAGDLISVPANTKHWFELGSNPSVRAIRIFTDQAGWVPHYTGSGIEERYRNTA
ncbi:acireductone dioxygenase [Nitrospira sp. KM1]|uniref:1,2-dihydroxy-3-keto-5-methylthiopentene dioxygenase n=1 Tax=Nitrospira sp. KM1 TaxID=1936990 RepID=UPI0013A77086|nr:cupin [Nitrospira sp. KM1]BCA56293.1 acireductone dioxygenase [Nitrospira sp. KM1]